MSFLSFLCQIFGNEKSLFQVTDEPNNKQGRCDLKCNTCISHDWQVGGRVGGAEYKQTNIHERKIEVLR